jgi:hypothetical protein
MSGVMIRNLSLGDMRDVVIDKLLCATENGDPDMNDRSVTRVLHNDGIVNFA